VENPDFISMRKDKFVLDETGMHAWTNETAGFEKRYMVPGDSTFKVGAEWFQLFCGDAENYYLQNVLN
jgi:hypothetical protein